MKARPQSPDSSMNRNPRKLHLLLLLVSLVLALPLVRAATVDFSSLGQPEMVAPGVELYRLADPALLSPPGPVAVQLLRVDPGRVALGPRARAGHGPGPRDGAGDGRSRTMALAAINAGFFLPTGEPAGLLKIERRAGQRHRVAPRRGRAGSGRLRRGPRGCSSTR